MERFLLGALYIFHLVVGRNLGPAEQNITKLSSVQKVHQKCINWFVFVGILVAATSTS